MIKDSNEQAFSTASKSYPESEDQLDNQDNLTVKQITVSKNVCDANGCNFVSDTLVGINIHKAKIHRKLI